MPDNQRTVDDVIAEWAAVRDSIGAPDTIPHTFDLLVDEITRLRSQVAQKDAEIERLQHRMVQEQQSHDDTISRRHEAEEAIADAYQAVVGHPAEWSNLFGYTDALEEISATIAHQQADLRTLAGAARVWEPVETASKEHAVILTDDKDVFEGFWDGAWRVSGNETRCWPLPTMAQPLPNPPDPTRDEAIAAAVQRALAV